MDCAEVWLALLDADLKVLEVSRALGRRLSLEQEAVRGTPLIDLIHSDDRPRVEGFLAAETLLKRGSVSVDCRLTDAHGGSVWMQISISAISAEEGSASPGLIAQVTEIETLKRSELESTELQKRWNTALEGASQGIWDHDFVSGRHHHSPAWYRMRGITDYARSPRGANTGLDTIHPEDRERVEDSIRRQETGEIDEVNIEYRERHSDGHWMWVLARGRWVEWAEDGRPTRMIGTDTDITDLKLAEEKIRKLSDSEMRWKIAVESADQGLWDVNHIDENHFRSDSWSRMRGFEPGDLVGSDEEAWFERLHPDDRARVKEQIKKQYSGELDVINYNYRERHKDGSWRWVLARGKPVAWDEKGLPMRFIGTDTDVTELKQRESELVQLSRRLEVALTASGLGAWEVDLEQHRHVWDARMMEIFGLDLPPGEVPEGLLEDMVHPDDLSDVTERVEVALSTGEPLNSQFRIIRKDGAVRHIRAMASTYVDTEGRQLFVGANWDVTEEVNQAEALLAANALGEQRNRELEKARADMEHISLHDALTGLPNRRFLDRVLREATDAGAKSMALLHIDLDRFKQINDTLGHAAGDATLQYIGELLRSEVGQHEIVARIGGDEFVVLIPCTRGREQVEDLARRIIAAAKKPIDFDGQECRTGVSIGIAMLAGDTMTDSGQLWVNADIALYRAKSEGRNRFVFFTAELQAEIVSINRCADDILKGLERGEFEAVYQPQFHTGSLDLAGIEALARWRHPSEGLLTPDRFLKVAEDLHVVAAIDRLVLEKSLAHMDDWQAAGIDVPRVSVNVSSRRLRDDQLIESLKKLDIGPNRISFELLESIFLDEQDDIVSWNIDQIRDLGINIDIDDFGTGHASIVSLLKLTPHRLKIDRQLVIPIVRSDQQRRMVKSIIEIGKSQGIDVVAEGVETREHVDILTDLGCDILQGYYFGRPMPAADLGPYLSEGAWRQAS